MTWTLQKAGGATTCASVPGQAGVSITVTKNGTTMSQNDVYTCTDGAGDSSHLAFGSYSVDVSLLNAQMQALGSAPVQMVTLASGPCDQIIAGECAKNIAVTITVN